MKHKVIQRMMKANKLSLSREQITEGLRRFNWLLQSKLEHSLVESEDEAGRNHCRIFIWNKGKNKCVARIGDSSDEARAKVGFEIPAKKVKI